MISYNKEKAEYFKGKGEISLIIKKKLFNINKRGGTMKWSPLHLAVLGGNLEIVELLASSKVDFDVENMEGKTPKDIS